MVRLARLMRSRQGFLHHEGVGEEFRGPVRILPRMIFTIDRVRPFDSTTLIGVPVEVLRGLDEPVDPRHRFSKPRFAGYLSEPAPVDGDLRVAGKAGPADRRLPFLVETPGQHAVLGQFFEHCITDLYRRLEKVRAVSVDTHLQQSPHRIGDGVHEGLAVIL